MPLFKSLLAKVLTTRGQVHPKRWDRFVASLGAVESPTLVVRPPADITCVYLW